MIYDPVTYTRSIAIKGLEIKLSPSIETKLNLFNIKARKN